MALKRNSRRPVGKQAATPRRLPRVPPPPTQAATQPGGELALPHERDEAVHSTADLPDPVIAQAKRDIDAGLVDTDMRATPGLEAILRAKLVPGPGGKSPG